MTTRLPLRRPVRPVPAKAQPPCGSVQATARVRLAPSLSRQVFEQHLRAIPAVRSAVHVIGDVGYELRLECHGRANPGLPDWPACRPVAAYGRVVIDSASEIVRLAALSRRRQRVLITYFVPVRESHAGTLALRTGRLLPSGERVGLAFTSEASLLLTMGPFQQWIRLTAEPLRDMLAPLGVQCVRVDPRPASELGPAPTQPQATTTAGSRAAKAPAHRARRQRATR